MRKIIGIDPGPEQSGVVIIDEDLKVLAHHSQIPTREIRCLSEPSFLSADDVIVVIEDLSPRGGTNQAQMFARWERTIQTAKTIGRLEQICAERGWGYVEIYPSTWRARICGAANARDAQIKACVRNIYKGQGLACGGGTHPAQGIKSKPGPLYGLKGHAWDALGVALAYLDKRGKL